jgi:hypothetical protein
MVAEFIHYYSIDFKIKLAAENVALIKRAGTPVRDGYKQDRPSKCLHTEI